MENTSKLTTAAMLTALVLAIELFAAKTGEIFVGLTIFSALPLFMIAKRSIRYGLISYLIVAMALFITNIHQMYFFVFTNGLIGLSLGLGAYFKLHKVISAIIAGILCTCGMEMIVIFVGFNVFTLVAKSSVIISILVVSVCMILYSMVYEWFALFVDRRVQKINKE